MPVRSSSEGILSDERAEARAELIEMLKKAYFMELETVTSYITNSINPDGVRAQEIKESLQEDVREELGHAQEFANRIKELYGTVPGSLEFTPEQTYLQPPEQATDIVHVIKGVIEAETGAIEHYNRIIEFTDEIDPVTNDMVIAILRDEEGHRRLFEGFPARVLYANPAARVLEPAGEIFERAARGERFRIELRGRSLEVSGAAA